MKALDIAQECTRENIAVTMLPENKFRVEGFSKSGNCVFYDTHEGVIAETRYDRKESISSVKDLAEIAYYWWKNYRNDSVFAEPAPHWLPIWEANGWIKVEAKVTYTPRE